MPDLTNSPIDAIHDAIYIALPEGVQQWLLRVYPSIGGKYHLVGKFIAAHVHLDTRDTSYIFVQSACRHVYAPITAISLHAIGPNQSILDDVEYQFLCFHCLARLSPAGRKAYKRGPARIIDIADLRQSKE